MQDTITIIGNVGKDPESFVTTGGMRKVSFRVATSARWFDKKKGEWVDGASNWYTVETFRQLADNVAASVRKGDSVIVSGRLRLRQWAADGKSGLAIEIDAEVVGHNLAWGTASFSRSPRREPASDGASSVPTAEAGLPATAGSPAETPF